MRYMVPSRTSLTEMPFVSNSTTNSVMVVTFIHIVANSRTVEALAALIINMIVYRREMRKRKQKRLPWKTFKNVFWIV